MVDCGGGWVVRFGGGGGGLQLADCVCECLCVCVCGHVNLAET